MYEILIRCLLFEKSHSHQPKKDGKIPRRVFEKCKKLREDYFGFNYITNEKTFKFFQQKFGKMFFEKRIDYF